MSGRALEQGYNRAGAWLDAVRRGRRCRSPRQSGLERSSLSGQSGQSGLSGLSVGTVGPVRAPWPVRPLRPAWSVVAIPPMVFAAGAVAIVIRVDTCAGEEAPTRPGAWSRLRFPRCRSLRVGLPALHCASREPIAKSPVPSSGAPRCTSACAGASGVASRHFGVRMRGAGLSRRSGLGPSMRRPC